jgi:hypothetical protein
MTKIVLRLCASKKDLNPEKPSTCRTQLYLVKRKKNKEILFAEVKHNVLQYKLAAGI